MIIKKINFETILPIWQSTLWLHRQSEIEPMSAMTWPYEGDPDPIDMDIFANYAPTFWGVYDGNKLVGVNSGHRSSEFHYRSRGIWVDPTYRGKSISSILFDQIQIQAVDEGCEMLWSIPRKTALKAYTKFGFSTVGDYISTETADANIYVIKRL